MSISNVTSRPCMEAICAWHSACPQLARRGRCARLSSILGLDGPRRTHGHSPHHGLRPGPFSVVDHCDEGMTPARAPGRFDLGLWINSKIRARQWPRPVFKPSDHMLIGSLYGSGIPKCLQYTRLSLQQCHDPVEFLRVDFRGVEGRLDLPVGLSKRMLIVIAHRIVCCLQQLHKLVLGLGLHAALAHHEDSIGGLRQFLVNRVAVDAVGWGMGSEICRKQGR